MKKIFIFSIIMILISLNIYYIYEKIYNTKIINKIFGIGIVEIKSGSMSPEIKQGEIAIIKSQKNYNINDVITFSVNNQYLVTHKIVDKIKNESIKEDKVKYITKGVGNNCNDEGVIYNSCIHGKVIFHSKFLGKLYNYRYHMIVILICFIIIFFFKEIIFKYIK